MSLTHLGPGLRRSKEIRWAVCLSACAGCVKPAPEPPLSVPTDSATVLRSSDAATRPRPEGIRSLPGVADVELLVAVENPARSVVHVRDWHVVPRDLYALDLRQAAGRPLDDREIDARLRELVREVDAIQQEQEMILNALAARYGLRRVLVEGLTPEGMANYRGVLSVFKATEDRLARLRESAAGLDPRPADIDRQVEAMARDLREKSLEYGASGRLMGRGVIDVLPLDDADLLEGARPVRSDGAVRFDHDKVEARHDGQVRRALAAGPCAVLVLGGAHDLSASVRRLGGGSTEYIRVTPKRYAEVTGGR